MTNQAIQESIRKMAQSIVKQFDPQMVVLFGSHARDEGGPDSDIDLLVVMPVKTSRRQVAIEIERALIDRQLPLDLIVVTPEEIQRDRERVDFVAAAALREGKILYERAA